MGKYEPLGNFLKTRAEKETSLRFDEVEAILGALLPPAAGRHPAWWSNNPSNNVMTKVWLDAGYRTERVDLSGRKVVFRRVAASQMGAPRLPETGNLPRRDVLAVVRRRLTGTVRMAPDFDPTAPTNASWDAEA